MKKSAIILEIILFVVITTLLILYAVHPWGGNTGVPQKEDKSVVQNIELDKENVSFAFENNVVSLPRSMDSFIKTTGVSGTTKLEQNTDVSFEKYSCYKTLENTSKEYLPVMVWCRLGSNEVQGVEVTGETDITMPGNLKVGQKITTEEIKKLFEQKCTDEYEDEKTGFSRVSYVFDNNMIFEVSMNKGEIMRLFILAPTEDVLDQGSK